jgi:hypothetical protein
MVLSANGDQQDMPIEFISDYKTLRPETTIYNIYNATRGKMIAFAQKGALDKKVMLQVPILSKGGVSVEGTDSKLYTQEEADALTKTAVETASVAAVEKYKVENPVTIETVATPLVMFMTADEAKTALSKELSATEVLNCAKEGIGYRKELVDAAIAWGVRADGNDFKAETWTKTLEGMSIEDIKNISAKFQKEAEAIPAGRKSFPGVNKPLEAQGELPRELCKS